MRNKYYTLVWSSKFWIVNIFKTDKYDEFKVLLNDSDLDVTLCIPDSLLKSSKRDQIFRTFAYVLNM